MTVVYNAQYSCTRLVLSGGDIFLQAYKVANQQPDCTVSYPARPEQAFSATRYLVACWPNLVHCLALKKKQCHLTRKDRTFPKQKAGTLNNIYVGLGGGGWIQFFLARHATRRKKPSILLKLQELDNSQQKSDIRIWKWSKKNTQNPDTQFIFICCIMCVLMFLL